MEVFRHHGHVAVTQNTAQGPFAAVCVERAVAVDSQKAGSSILATTVVATAGRVAFSNSSRLTLTTVLAT
jgi:hypothetical protein